MYIAKYLFGVRTVQWLACSHNHHSAVKSAVSVRFTPSWLPCPICCAPPDSWPGFISMLQH